MGDQHQGLAGSVQPGQQAADLLRRWRCPALRSARRPAATPGSSPGRGRSRPAAAARRTAARIGVGSCSMRSGPAFARPAAGPGGGTARRAARQQHVVGDGQVVEQGEELEDHAELRRGGTGPARSRSCGHPLPSHGHRSGRGPVQPRNQVQQRRLPAARRPHHRHRFSRRDCRLTGPPRAAPSPEYRFVTSVSPIIAFMALDTRPVAAGRSSADGCKRVGRRCDHWPPILRAMYPATSHGGRHRALLGHNDQMNGSRACRARGGRQARAGQLAQRLDRARRVLRSTLAFVGSVESRTRPTARAIGVDVALAAAAALAMLVLAARNQHAPAGRACSSARPAPACHGGHEPESGRLAARCRWPAVDARLRSRCAGLAADRVLADPGRRGGHTRLPAKRR